ncbi:MAG: hypothetical protein QOG04_789 [Actinomycetota bacterium]|jgi:hypothetical protein|nr:hypothetical protein [Actinomycetota bacterium]
MSRIVTIFVAISIIEAVALGIGFGFDVAALSILATMVALGVLAIVIARKSETDAIGPATCSACGGLMSPNAPYCKHCGEPVGA